MPPRKRLFLTSEPVVTQPIEQVDTVRNIQQSLDSPIHDVSRGESLHTNDTNDLVSGPLVSSTGSTGRTKRGPTLGKGIDRLVGKQGKLGVDFLPQFKGPVGPNASKLSSAGGMEVRSQLLDLGPARWSDVPDTSITPIVQSINDRFNLHGEDKVINKMTKSMLSKARCGFTHRLHKIYKKLKAEGGPAFARDNPPLDECKAEQWISVIDSKFTDEKWLSRAEKNAANRAKAKLNHLCGSKSLAIRAHKMIQENDKFDFPAFFKDCRFNAEKNAWVTPACEDKHREMIDMQQRHCSQPDTIELTAEEISMKVLGTKSGILKGLGMKPSASSTCTSRLLSVRNTELDERIQQLETERQQQNAQLDATKAQLDATKAQLDATNVQLASLVDFLKTQGYNGI